MKTYRGIGLLLVTLVWGCGSSSSNPTPNTNTDGPGTVSDAPGMSTDQAPNSNSDARAAADVAPAADSTLAADVAGTAVQDGSALDATITTSDTLALADTARTADAPATPDGPLAAEALPPPPDAAPLLAGTTLVASTTTSDDNTDPAICSTVVLADKVFSADQTYDIVMPDCVRVSGTVTLADPLPNGAVFGNAMVNAFKITLDGNGKVSNMVSYAASVTAMDASHFQYSMSVPADTYEMQYQLIVKSGAQIPSVADRIGQEELTVGPSPIKHDVTLPAIDVIAHTVTVTGTDALASNGKAFGRMLEVIALNPSNTLMVTGISMTGGASVPISMWFPRGTITPFIMVEESPSTFAPYVGGLVSQFRLDPVTPTGDFSLAQPAAVKISGTVSDPSHALSPMMTVGTTGSSAVNYYQCDPVDTGTFPHPIFLYPEGSTSSYFSASTSHAFYVRKGLACVLYANYALAMGSPGATPTVVGENTYAYMEDPTVQSPNAVTMTTDLTRNVTVPNPGPQVTVTGTVKDARGKSIPGAVFSILSRSLNTAAVADKTLSSALDATSSGTYTLHVLPGTYGITMSMPKSSATTTNPDAGVTTNKDAAPDIGFSLPDLGAGGGCSTLAACCPSLTGNNKTLCTTVVATSMDSSCSTYLSIFQLQGSCQ